MSGLVCRKQRVAKDCLGCGHDLGRGLKQAAPDGHRPQNGYLWDLLSFPQGQEGHIPPCSSAPSPLLNK